MSNLKFCGSENSETEDHTLSCFNNTDNEIYLCIEMDDKTHFSFISIALDIPTAIHFSKHLRKSISYAKGLIKEQD